jgi:hypothetical protein
MITKGMSIDLAVENVTSTLLYPGFVQTHMTGGVGSIDVTTSVAGMLRVLEKYTLDELQGAWHDYKGEYIPW